jgi:hypothetical protein
MMYAATVNRQLKWVKPSDDQLITCVLGLVSRFVESSYVRIADIFPLSIIAYHTD